MAYWAGGCNPQIQGWRNNEALKHYRPGLWHR